MYGDKSQPKMLDLIGPKGQIIPNAKINLEHYITEEQFEELFYKENMSYKEIMKSIGFLRDSGTFSRIVRKLGWKKEKGKENKYKVNERFFDTWTKESAWVFGWILTDGHVHDKYIDITLQARDKDIPLKIKDVMEFTGDLYEYGNTAGLRIYNRKLVEKVRSLGLPRKDKTHKCEYPPMEPEVEWDFIRGVFEGDGSISIKEYGTPRVLICGASEGLMEGVVQFLENQGVDLTIRIKDGFYMTQCSNVESSIRILHGMYAQAPGHLRMNRKYGKVKEYCKVGNPRRDAAKAALFNLREVISA